MIEIVNYGLGNIHAFANIYKRLNIPAEIASETRQLRRADKIILPGVGAFDWAMTRLNESGLRRCLEELVIDHGVPVLGICVGMQILAKQSEEGVLGGLGWIDADVKKFDCTTTMGMQLPQMGWNDVQPLPNEPLFSNLTANARFYFLHSYYVLPANEDDVTAVTDYHGPYASSVRSRNVYGVQFHPEKSHHWGVQLLKNFAQLI